MKSLLFESGGHSLQIAWMLLRVSVGIIFITHGYPKLVGGVEKWDWMGQQMSLVGINFWPRFWGFLAAAAESAGGLLLIFGLFTRISSLLMLGVHEISDEGPVVYSCSLVAFVPFVLIPQHLLSI